MHKTATSSVRAMRLFLALLLVTTGAVFAKTAKTSDVFDPEHQALALDCPMVNTRIIGTQTEIWPDVSTWEECGG